MSSFKPKMEILPDEQKLLWPELKPVNKFGFVLYGGTAVALRLGHRTSVDFDFFSDQSIIKDKLLSDIPILQKSKIIQDQPQTCTLLVPINKTQDRLVKISFFGTINFGRLDTPEYTDDGVMQIASKKDLLATKLKVLMQRVELKDYADIAELIRDKISLEAGLAGACELYGSNFQPSECLKALTYFEGGDLDTLTDTHKEILVSAVREVHKLPSVKVVSKKLSL